MITRRSLFSLTGLAPAAAMAESQGRHSLDEFRIRRVKAYGSCADTWCESEDSDHLWIVTDKLTNVYRVMCEKCKDEFMAAPHRLVAPPSSLY